MFLTLLHLAFAVGTAPSTEPTLANIADIFSTDDYPVDALKAGKEGNVTALVNVDQQGAPSACRVTKSSRVPSLDEATCRILLARARFEPLRDSAEQPVASISHPTIRWVLPGDRIAVNDIVIRTTFDLSSDGSLSNCNVQMNSKAVDNMACPRVQSMIEQIPPSERSHLATFGNKLTLIDGYVIGNDENGNLFATLAGPGRTSGFTIAVAIDDRGRPSECHLRTTAYSVPAEHRGMACERALKQKFMPIVSKAADRSARHFVTVSGIVIHN